MSVLLRKRITTARMLSAMGAMRPEIQRRNNDMSVVVVISTAQIVPGNAAWLYAPKDEVKCRAYLSDESHG
jgi:hypothetical protein